MMPVRLPVWGLRINLVTACLLCISTTIYAIPNPPSTAILLNGNPVNVKRFMYHPYRVLKKRKSPFPDLPLLKRDDDYYEDDDYSPRPSFPERDVFHFQAEDAVDEMKFSPAVIENNPSTPSSYLSHSNFMPTSFSSVTHFQRPTIQVNTHSKEHNRPIIPQVHSQHDLRPGWNPVVGEATVTSEYKVGMKMPPLLNDEPVKDQPHLLRNNFTDTVDSQLSESSSKILKSHSSSNDSHQNKHVDTSTTTKLPINNLPDNSSVIMPSLESETLLKDSKDNAVNIKPLSPNISTLTTTTEDNLDLIKNNSWTTPSSFDKENISDILPSIESSRTDISSGALAGMIIAILCGVTVLSSSVIYLLYKKFNGKCTSVVDSKFNSDNCGYLDDSLRSSIYLNNHIELPKENSEEMTSLDNDSFLNSLETMTIQNYWTDNTKNTKV